MAFARRPQLALPWFTQEANRDLGKAWLEDSLRLPLGWGARLREWRRSRYVQTAIRGIARISMGPRVQVVHPFADPEFVSALAREGGLRGYPSRAAAMDAHFGEVLPRSVRERSTKASFDGVLWSRHSRAFASELDADDLHTALSRLQVDGIVDRTALVAHWATTPSPRANSFLLLQACSARAPCLTACRHGAERRRGRETRWRATLPLRQKRRRWRDSPGPG